MTDVICEYIYLKLDDDGNKIDRRPSSGVFQPREFAELVHKFTNTFDILFRNDINPTAFALALEPLQAHGDLELSGVENLPIGQLYRFKVPDNFPKEQAHAEFWHTYEDTRIKLKAAEDRILIYRERIKTSQLSLLMPRSPSSRLVINMKTFFRNLSFDRSIDSVVQR